MTLCAGIVAQSTSVVTMIKATMKTCTTVFYIKGFANWQKVGESEVGRTGGPTESMVGPGEAWRQGYRVPIIGQVQPKCSLGAPPYP